MRYEHHLVDQVTVNIQVESEVTSIIVEGDFTRELDPRKRDELLEKIASAKTSNIFISMKDVVLFDSWGEVKFADAMSNYLDDGRRVAVLFDGTRPHQLVGLSQYVKDYSNIIFDSDAEILKRWLA